MTSTTKDKSIMPYIIVCKIKKIKMFKLDFGSREYRHTAYLAFVAGIEDFASSLSKGNNKNLLVISENLRPCCNHNVHLKL